MKIKTSLTVLLFLLTTLSYSQGVVFSSGDFDFEVYGKDSTMVRLNALDGTLKGDIVIPESVSYKGKTYAVTLIGNMGDNPSVLSIRIPQTVRSVSSLNSLSSLQNIYVDEANPSFKSIDGVLVSTSNMSLIEYPCGRIGDCIVPEGIVRINTSFHEGITKLTIPSSVTYIHQFIGDYVTEFDVAEGNANYSSINGALYSKDGKTLIAYPATNESIVSIPSSVDSVGTFAFQNSKKIILNSATPPAISSISPYSITGIYVKSSDLINYQSNPRISKFNLFGYDIIEDSILYAKANDGNAEVVGSFSQSASLVIPQEITDKTGNTFNVTKIGRTVFYRNYTLNNIKLPETLRAIGDSAFYNTNLKEITLPASLTEIGKDAFYYCYNLYNVYADCAPIDVSAGCFYPYKKLYVPSEYEDQYKVATGWMNFSIVVNDMTDNGFIYKKLTDETASVVEYVGDAKDIVVPDVVDIKGKSYKITEIGQDAFYYKGIERISLPQYLKTIGDGAFYDNYSLADVKLPAGLQTIGERAFGYCNISNLDIPLSIKEIGEYAFSGYNNILIHLKNHDLFEIGYAALGSTYNTRIYISPASSVNTFKLAENWKDYRYIYGVDGMSDGVGFKILSDTEAAVVCCDKHYDSSTNIHRVDIPEMVTIDNQNYKVTTIADSAFYESSANYFVIPATVDSIGYRAFYMYDNLTILINDEIPARINDEAFYQWYNHTILVPSTVVDAYKETAGWVNVKDYIQANGTLIDGIIYSPLDDDRAVVSLAIEIPSNDILVIPGEVNINNKTYKVAVVGSGAFSTNRPKYLFLPETIDSIYSSNDLGSSFTYLQAETPPCLGRNNYNHIYVPSSALNAYQENQQWVPYNYYKDRILGTDGIVYNDSIICNINNTTKAAELIAWTKDDTNSIEIPGTFIVDATNIYTITSLSGSAINDYYSLQSIKIPETIINIDAYALPTTSNLIVICEAVAPPAIGEHNSSNNQRQTLYVKSAAYDSYKNADVWKDFGNIVAIDAGDDQFYYAKAGNGKAKVTGLKVATVQEAEIPETVVIDGERLIVSQIGTNLFANNRNIQKLSLPNTIEEIGDKAFFGSSLQQITVPASVNSIGERAFATNPDNYSYSSLRKIQVRAGNEYYMQRNENLLLTKDGKKLIQSTRNDIGPSYSWGYNEKGQYVRMEINPLDGIEEIAAGALDGCESSAIRIPASLSYADASMLMYMTNLQKIDVDTLHQNLCSIDGVLFSKDTTSVIYFPYVKSRYSDYKNYELPEKVQTIEKFSFYSSQLESLTLSDCLKTIADSAFYDNRYYSPISSLILINDNIASASETAFNNDMYQNTILYVPMGTQNDYLTTSPWSNFRNINSTKLAEEDFLLLKAFYEEMGNGEGWYRQWSFGTTADETRITRGIRMIDDHVYSIDLSNNGLKGGLSDKIFKLPRLEILNLSSNNLSCPIDSVLNEENVDNTVLRELNVSNNQLTGNIGSVTNTLKNLTTLNASYNNLSQVTPMLSSNIYSLNLNYQTMNDTIDYKSLCQATKENVEAGQPNLLFYDHNNRNYTTSHSFTLQNTDNAYWYMSLRNNGENVSVSEYSSAYRLYKRPNGNILRLSGNNGHSLLVRMLFDKGDVNFDTLVNVSDLQLTVNYAVSEKTGQLFNFTTADIVEDDWVNVQDVVSLVNLLLDQDIDTSNGSRAKARAAANEEDAEALLFLRGNQLILRTENNIAAMDIAIENAKNVKWLLNDADYDFNISKKNDYIRIIHYSIAGKNIKAGETVLAEVTGEGLNILKAELVNKEAIPVKTARRITSTGIEDTYSMANIKLSANTMGLNILATQPMNKLHWTIYSIGGELLGSGVTNVSVGYNTLKCDLAGERQVIVCLSNVNVNITKKVIITK